MGFSLVNMTFSLFQLLSPTVPLCYVLQYGTFVARRWENAAGINRYHLPPEGRGFFAEIGYDDSHRDALVRRSFRSSVPLPEDAQWVRLPNG